MRTSPSRTLATLAFMGVAVGLALVGAIAASTRGGPKTSASSSESPARLSPPEDATPPDLTSGRPPDSRVRFAVLTDRSTEELRALSEREAVAANLAARHCGDEVTCAAVRATLLDEGATDLRVLARSDYVEGSGIDASTDVLSAFERDAAKGKPRVVLVTVTTPTSTSHLALRAGLAATAVLAERAGGFVHDALLARLERPAEFAAHCVTTRLGVSTFRRDRVELLYQPKADGVVRVLTRGLSRWGAADVEAARVPVAAEERVGEILLAVAQVLTGGTGGAPSAPFLLSREDLARARGQGYPPDAGFPVDTPIAIQVASVHSEEGDSNDFVARVEPPQGDGPIGYLELAEGFFGPLLTAPPEPKLAEREQDLARGKLTSALARLARGSPDQPGAALLVRLPFAIPGDAGFESLWVAVTRWDDRTVTGKLLDEPLGATDLVRGSEVSAPRSLVEDVRWDPRER